MYPIHAKDWEHYCTRIVDHGLNVAVLVIANRLFPGGFDISNDAPDTYEKLVAQFESGQRYVVYAGGSDTTIFGDPCVNHHFRAWHDWCHWQGRFDFSLAGEFGAYKMQCQHLVARHGENDTTARWKRILFADVIGQKLYFQRTGLFPDDQLAFVRDYLAKGLCEEVQAKREPPEVTQVTAAAE